MYSFKTIYLVIFTLRVHEILATISDKRLCIDPECSELISEGKTLIRFPSNDDKVLSFGLNEDVKVYSYGAGSKPNYIGVEIRGKRGYVNKRHIRETRLVKNPKLLLDTELEQDKPQVPLEDVIKADPVQQSYEIVDGTKIPRDPSFSSTEAPSLVSDSSEAVQEAVNVRETASIEESKSPEPNQTDTETNNQTLKNPTLNEKIVDVNNAETEDTKGSPDQLTTAVENNNDEHEAVKIPETISAENEILPVVGAMPNDQGIVNKEKSNEKETETIFVTTEPSVLEEEEIPLNVDATTANSVNPEAVEHPDQIQIDSRVEEKEADSSENKQNEDAATSANILNFFIKSATDVQEQKPNETIEGININAKQLDDINKDIPSNTETLISNSTLSDPSQLIPNENVASNENIISNEDGNSVEINDVITNNENVADDENIVSGEDGNSVQINEDVNTNDENNQDLPPINKDDSVDINDTNIIEDFIESDQTVTKNDILENQQVDADETKDGFLSNVMSFLGVGESETPQQEAFVEDKSQDSSNIQKEESIFSEDLTYTDSQHEAGLQEEHVIKSSVDKVPSSNDVVNNQQETETPNFCEAEDKCPPAKDSASNVGFEFILQSFSSDLFLYLSTTALSVILFLFGYLAFDNCKREGPLIARINKLEQQLLTTLKENEMLQEKTQIQIVEQPKIVTNNDDLAQKLAEMQIVKVALEEQVQALEKELDNSTEVGIELNRIISEMLSSKDGSDILKENVEQMQKRLLEQQDTINKISEILNLKETENHELHLELEIGNKKVVKLQGEMDKLVDKILKIEDEKDQQQNTLEGEMAQLQKKIKETASKEIALDSELQVSKSQIAELQRLTEMKTKEYNILKESLNEIKSVKNNTDVKKSLIEYSEIKAQLEQLKGENSKYSEQLRLEQESNVAYARKIQTLTDEVTELRRNLEKSDKGRLEKETKLEVLNNYFKEREEQLQKEIAKYESLWVVKEGEASSTTERIRLLQDELQNYKAQNESLKQEIVSQEVELKSQISVLEKKVHENWVTNRQAERKLEEAKQEAAQLRNMLTLKQRPVVDGNNQIRIQSPLQQNGELPLSPPPPESTISPPPPLYNPRDLTMSPSLPGMPPPPPFLPPPPGGFMPPLLGRLPPPFMPPLPPFPGDHRPPPLGRMSSPPPLNSRYSPESLAYSERDRYDRNSPSPIYDSEYGASPPNRGYSPFEERYRDERREYKRPQARSNGRNPKSLHSSGSENDSLEKLNRKAPKNV